jgi:N-acetylmuramoyl-L-alanine amidase
MNERVKTTHKPRNSFSVWGRWILVLYFMFSVRPDAGAFINGFARALLPLKDKVKTVCIDPGHGGHDSGCQGASVYEKNIALAISLKLGDFIETHLPDVKVVYTRKTDVFVELHRRAEIANQANADLFICIHCNAGPQEANGSETFVLGLHKSEANLAVAKRENEAVLLEPDYKQHYEGFDINSPEGNVIFSLYQNTYLNRSLSFAARVQNYFRSEAGRFDRGVKQAGFLVLWKTAMPAVLIETGFLTNRLEEKYLMAAESQRQMALSIFKAFVDYKNEVEGTAFYPLIPEGDKKPEHGENSHQPLSHEHSGTQSLSSEKKQEVVFRVQIYSGPQVSNPSQKFRNAESLWWYKTANGYAYTCGESQSPDEMKSLQDRMRKSGYPDAFVVAFYQGSRVSVKEALGILNKKE